MDDKDWGKNKILGSIAEACVEQHFSQLGYIVEKTGIENMAPHLAHLSSIRELKWGSYSKIREKIRYMPDFLISRIHPAKGDTFADTQLKENDDKFGRKEVLFVEAKYRTNPNIKELEKEFEVYKEYDSLVYLVANGWHGYKGKSGDDVCVFLNYLPFKKWFKAGDRYFDEHLLYKGEGDVNFNSIYKDTIQPSLNTIFNK